MIQLSFTENEVFYAEGLLINCILQENRQYIYGKRGGDNHPAIIVLSEVIAKRKESNEDVTG